MDAKEEVALRSDAGRAKQIEVERDGDKVNIVMNCSSEYDAMMLYDRLIEELKNGYLKFEVCTNPRL